MTLDLHMKSLVGPYSLEAKHPILVWIMKVEGPKNQADFIEVLYVLYGEPLFVILPCIPIGSEKWHPLDVTVPPKDEIYI